MPIDRKPAFFQRRQLKVGSLAAATSACLVCRCASRSGHKVTGFDTESHKVTMLNAGKSYTEHFLSTIFHHSSNSRHFSRVARFREVKKPMPSSSVFPHAADERREPDLIT